MKSALDAPTSPDAVLIVGHRLNLLDAIAALRSDTGVKSPSVDAGTTSGASSAPPEDRAERLAKQAAHQRQIELVVEVKRLARQAVIYSIRAAGDEVQRWTPAEIEARWLVCPWLIAKAKERIAERNLKHQSNTEVV